MNIQDLHKAIVETYGLPEDSMFCGPSPIPGYIAISIPMSAQVMRRLADAMDPQVKPEGKTKGVTSVWVTASRLTHEQREVALDRQSPPGGESLYNMPWNALTIAQQYHHKFTCKLPEESLEGDKP